MLLKIKQKKRKFDKKTKKKYVFKQEHVMRYLHKKLFGRKTVGEERSLKRVYCVFFVEFMELVSHN